MPAQKCSQGLPLKFQGGTFGAIKIFRKKKFDEIFTGSEPEIDILRPQMECLKYQEFIPYVSFTLLPLSNSILINLYFKKVKRTKLLINVVLLSMLRVWKKLAGYKIGKKLKNISYIWALNSVRFDHPNRFRTST